MLYAYYLLSLVTQPMNFTVFGGTFSPINFYPAQFLSSNISFLPLQQWLQQKYTLIETHSD